MDTTKPLNYISEAMVTCSDQYHGDKVTLKYLAETLHNCIKALEDLDEIKKALFYGRKIEIPTIEGEATVAGIPGCVSASPEIGELLIHGIIGKATEAGEMLEALAIAMTEGEGIDAVNLVEEVGDGFWYDAVILNALGSSFEEAQRVNIMKLRNGRYGDKFTEYDANNRDLFAERKILEKGVDSSK